MGQQTDYKIYDVDNHYYEPADAFLTHLPKKFAKAFQFIEINGRTKLAVNNLISDYIPNPTFDVVAGPGAHEIYYRGQNTEGKSLREITGDNISPCRPEWRYDKEAKLKVMDEQGIHACLMFPTLASVVEERIDEHELVHAVMHSLNEWIYETWGFGADGRIYGVPVITLMDVDSAVEELDLVLSRGARTVLVRPAPVKGYRGTRSFGYEEFDPFWSRINESGIFVCLHASDSGYDSHAQKWEGGYEYRPFEPTGLKAVVGLMERAIADSVTALICHGVFDRFPNVKIVSVENGARWVKPLMDRFDHAYGQLPQQFSRHPAETFRKHFYVNPFYEDDVDELASIVGIDHMLFGSDFPHPEGLADPMAYINELKGFSAQDRQKIMSGNLQRLLGVA